jgi:hypothetical protein
MSILLIQLGETDPICLRRRKRAFIKFTRAFPVPVSSSFWQDSARRHHDGYPIEQLVWESPLFKSRGYIG